jgi:hypothetical protein
MFTVVDQRSKLIIQRADQQPRQRDAIHDHPESVSVNYQRVKGGAVRTERALAVEVAAQQMKPLCACTDSLENH